MTSGGSPRPVVRGTLARTGALVVLVAAVVLVNPSAASAAVLTVPDSSGAYMVCKANVAPMPRVNFPSASMVNAYVSCNYSLPSSIGAANITGVRHVEFTFDSGAVVKQSLVGGTGTSCGEQGSVNPERTELLASQRLRAAVCASQSSMTYRTLTSVKINYSKAGGGGVDGAARIEGAHGTTNGYPATYPADYYPGGVAGASAPAPVVTCSRTLERADMVGRFTASVVAVENATDSYSWDFGDGSNPANKTTQGPVHTYPALSSMPVNGWTAVVTVTRTGAAPTYDPTPVSSTCSLRVDFLNPSESTAGGSTSDSRKDLCDNGWGFLSPSAWGDLLRCLFIPTDTGFDDTKAAFEESILSVPTGGLVAMKTSFDVLKERSDNMIANKGYSDCSGPEVVLPVPGLGTASGAEGSFSPGYSSPNQFHLRPLYACSGPIQGVAEAVRLAALVAFYIFAAFAISGLYLRGLFGIHLNSPSPQPEPETGSGSWDGNRHWPNGKQIVPARSRELGRGKS